MIRKWTRNGLNCASKLRPGKPIFLASDLKYASEFWVVYGGKQKAIIVTHPNNPDPPLHFDKGEDANTTSTTSQVLFDFWHEPLGPFDDFS
jgi:hypothetical protein